MKHADPVMLKELTKEKTKTQSPFEMGNLQRNAETQSV